MMLMQGGGTTEMSGLYSEEPLKERKPPTGLESSGRD